MKACILTIGDELLQGFSTDTNSSWIGKILLSYKIYIQKIITVGDNHNSIINETKKIIEENFDFIFVTGGLGPTHDDITKKAFCELFSDEMYLDENYFLELEKRFEKLNVSEKYGEN